MASQWSPRFHTIVIQVTTLTDAGGSIFARIPPSASGLWSIPQDLGVIEKKSPVKRRGYVGEHPTSVGQFELWGESWGLINNRWLGFR